MESSAAQRVVSELPQHAVPPAPSLAADLLTCLNRAVQRATIYPPEHPAVRQAVAPLLRASQLVFARVPRLVVFVSRHALVVQGSRSQAESLQLPWLSARLSERGLASVTLTRGLDEGAAVALVSWLAQPSADAGPSPQVRGLLVAWRDYSRTRFSGQGRASEGGADALLMWQRVVHGLAADWFDCEGDAGAFDADELAEDPVALAKCVRHTLLSQEGTGVSAIASRVFTLGGRLGELNDAGRVIVRQKLAGLLTELAPELRGQLLRIVPSDSPDKLATLSEVIDDLPQPLILEILRNMEVGATGDPSPFITLLSKMVSVSAQDAELSEALGQSLTRAGLPGDILNRQPDEVREALETLFNTPVDRASMSEAYRSELDALTAQRLPASEFDGAHFYAPTRADHLALEVPKIAMALLAASPTGSDASTLLDRAKSAVPALLAAEDVEALSLLANIARSVSSRGSAPPEEIAKARETLATLARRAVVDVLMKAVDDAGTMLPLTSGDLFCAGGLMAADAALDRLVSTPSPVVHSRAIGLLGQLDAAVFRVALTEARRMGRLPTRVVQGLMCHQELAHLVEIADLFSLDPDPELRLQSNKILFSSAHGTCSDRAVRRALEDVDPRVVAVAVADVCTRQDESGVRALSHLLARTDDAGLNRAQRKTVAFLEELRTPAAREALETALASRRFAVDRTSRLVSVLVARGLERFGDSASLQAVRAWRWSPAGIMSLFTREGRRPNE